MKVYCAGPIRGGLDFQDYYKHIVSFVSEIGNTALCEFNNDFFAPEQLSDDEIFDRDIKWLENSDIMIAEVSAPSLGAGFEISYALYKKEIPVLALFNTAGGNLSAMISGCSSELLTLRTYSNKSELENIILEFVNSFISDDN